MSEENKTKTVTSHPEVTGQASAEAKAQVRVRAELTVQDLTVIRSIIDVASQRGVPKPTKWRQGTTYNKLDGFSKDCRKILKGCIQSIPAEGDKEAEKK